MTESLISFLIVFPLAIAALVSINRKENLFPAIVYPACVVLSGASLLLLGAHAGGQMLLLRGHAGWVEPAMLIAEVGLAAYLLYLAFRQKEWIVTGLLLVQTVVLLGFHFGPGHQAHAQFNLYIDLFAVIMGLIVGVIGTLIAVYAVSYMRELHHHDHDLADRRPLFFGLIFLFLSAMFGICFSNNLFWLFFFWEITTVCSFLMIRYKGDEISVKNAFWALRWNMLGGVAFLLGIIVLYQNHHTVELSGLLALPKMLVLLPVALISFAGMTKSAQLPFSSWLVGAMVAPTPVSALLHSSTMVKAGVYIVLRFATLLEGTALGMIVALVGLVTFLLGSFICISQSDGKKVLAYSTIANLGLIILCAGIGTYEAVWAGILLIIFHAISKGLLFLCVGSIEHTIGSRNIEKMTGLVHSMPLMAAMLRIGICGMFLAPFGMLISKWAVLKAIVDYNPLFAILLVYGSAATLFFWVKWIGKVIIVDREYDNVEDKVAMGQWIPLGTLTVLTVAICALFAPIAHVMIDPYIMSLYSHAMSLGAGNMFIMMIMLGMIALFPVAFFAERGQGKIVKPYLAGANVGPKGAHFIDSFGAPKDYEMRNYYMDDYFSESSLMRLGVLMTTAILVVMLAIGGM